MKMEDYLINMLETFGYPVRRQGSLGEGEAYPENFFTFWNNESHDHYYDNKAAKTVYNYDVNFYSTDPVETYEKLREATGVLRRAGFIISGDGYDIGSDVKSHTGRGCNVLYVKYNREGE